MNTTEQLTLQYNDVEQETVNNNFNGNNINHNSNESLIINNAHILSNGNPVSRRSSFQHQKSLSQQQLFEVTGLLSRQRTFVTNIGNDEDMMKIEMCQLYEDKTLSSDLFDKIDSKKNEDLDINEWIQGLKRLNVTLNENEMKTIFQCMDGDESEYISREDFMVFCIRSFQSAALRNLQQQLILQVKGHVRQPSNLLRSSDNIKEWDPIAMQSMQREMQEHMASLASNMVDSVQVEAKFYEEMEKRADDPSFANPDNAPEWSPAEVAFWLDSINFGQYSRRFHDDAIDGSILLNDVDRNMLQSEMGIKHLHVGKMLREIEKLRQKHAAILHLPCKDNHQISKENETLKNQLNVSLVKIQELEKKIAQLQNQNINKNNDPRDESVENTTTDNVFIENRETKNEQDPLTITKLTQEIESLQQSKYDLVIATDKELQYLRKMIRILSGEYETLQTPKSKRNNLFDSIIKTIGYDKKTNQ